MKKRSFLTVLVMLIMLVAVHSESLKIIEEKSDNKVVIEYTATDGTSLRMFKYTNRTAEETFSTFVNLYGFPTAIIGVDNKAIPFFREQGYMCFTSKGCISFTVYNKVNNSVQMYVFSTLDMLSVGIE